MKRFTLFICGCLALGGLLSRGGSAADDKPGKIALFDGQSLAGWKDAGKEWIVAKVVALDANEPKEFASQPGAPAIAEALGGDEPRLEKLTRRRNCRRSLHES